MYKLQVLMELYWQNQAKPSCRTDWKNVVEPAAANTRDAEHGEEDNADDVEPEVEPACNCYLRSRRHGAHGQLEGEWEAGGDEAVPGHSQEQDGDVGLDHSGRVDNTNADQGEVDEDQSGKHVEDSNSDLKIPVADVNDPDSSNTSNGAADGGEDGQGILLIQPCVMHSAPKHTCVWPRVRSRPVLAMQRRPADESWTWTPRRCWSTES